MNKYTKKWGGEVQRMEMRCFSPESSCRWMHGLNVTPQMKEAALRSQPLFMTNSQKHIYGWALDNTIYLTPRGMNTETAIHEYTHLWAEVMKQKDPQGWQQIKNLLRDTPVWNEVLKDKNYRYLRRDEDRVTNEALARISGRENTVRLEQAVKQAVKRDASLQGFLQIREALSKFWSWVGKHILHIKEAKSVSEITDRILGDLLRGEMVSKKVRPETNQISDIQIILSGKNPFLSGKIRCKVNGEQQLSDNLSPKETALWRNAPTDTDRKTIEHQLAERHFLGTNGLERQRGLKIR